MSMNIFRLCGDASHVAAVVLLLHQLWRRQDARGISLRTQELFLLVFVARYLDLFTTYYSLYNSLMKITYVLTSIWAVFALRLPRGRVRYTYAPQEDAFPHWTRSAAPCLALAVATNFIRSGAGGGGGLLELLWTYSIFQESVAMVPQLVLMHYHRDWGPEVGKYVFFIWLYRTLYIFNWVYRAYHEPMYRHHVPVYISGVVQSGIIVIAWVIRLRTPEPASRALRQAFEEEEGLGYGLLLDDLHEHGPEGMHEFVDDDAPIDREEGGGSSAEEGNPPREDTAQTEDDVKDDDAAAS